MKTKRQRVIIEMVKKGTIATQEELTVALRGLGFDVTQATVSRDIKELGLLKIPHIDGGYRYAMPGETKSIHLKERLHRLFQDAVTMLDYSENIILIRTLPGTAQAVAACLDQAEWEGIMGTVAGDDTILVLVKPKEMVQQVLAGLQSLLE